MEVLGGGILLSLVRPIRHAPTNGAFLLWVLLIGILLRGVVFRSTPIQEDDFYRYFWDGAVVAHGMNPYARAPGDVLEGRIPDGPEASRLADLAQDSGVVIERINHPWLRTIYPPVAQAAFAVSHLLKPWNLGAWRFILLAVDIVVFVLVIHLLRQLGLSPLWSVLYWWSPLLVKEIYNSGHMDLLAIPFVLLALLLATRERYTPAALCLALGAGVKMWPVVLLPVILRPVLAEPRRLLPAVLIFALVLGVLFLPVYRGGLDENSGFRAYGRKWEMNDALFMVFLWGSERFLGWIGQDPAGKDLVSRGIAAAILAVWTFWCVRRRPERPLDLFEASFLVVSGLFLLSPTQFPWYFVWVLPLLVLRPCRSMLLLSALLPLYYLRFHFQGLETVPDLPGWLGWLATPLRWQDISRPVEVFDERIVWLIYVPVWAVIAWEWLRSVFGKSPWLSEAVES